MEQFVYLIQPVRESFITTMTEEESVIMERHFDYLKGMQSNHQLVLAGPCTDGAFGIVVFMAKDMETAQRIMLEDPSVEAGVMGAKLHPFRISLMQSGVRI